jgi:hypothetical protein
MVLAMADNLAERVLTRGGGGGDGGGLEHDASFTAICNFFPLSAITMREPRLGEAGQYVRNPPLRLLLAMPPSHVIHSMSTLGLATRGDSVHAPNGLSFTEDADLARETESRGGIRLAAAMVPERMLRSYQNTYSRS